MKKHTVAVPHASPGLEKGPEHNLPAFGDKRAVGALAGGMSKRWVDGEMEKGMPHLKLGARRVRFDLEEVRAWLKQRYGTRRLGTLNGTEARIEESAS